MINELDSIEDDTDQMQIKLRMMLGAVSKNAITRLILCFCIKILEWIGGLADQAQRVGARIELMLACSLTARL